MVSNRVRRSSVIGAAIALTLLLPSPRAQELQQPTQDPLGPTAPRDFSHDVPAHLAFVEGEVTLERDAKLEPAERNLTLLAGDRLRTRSGRVEILYADGSTLAVDHDTSLDLLSDSLVRLLGGRLRVAILRTTDTLDYRIDNAAASVGIQVAGEYRIQTGVDADGDPDVDLTVIRGSAELVNDNGRTLVNAGRHAFTSAKTAPSLAYTVNSAAWDDFDRWVEDRRTARVGSISSSYLPEEVQYYGNTLDDYGTWGTDPSIGAVWYPRVADDWMPYSQGRWSYTGYYGWVWVGIDAWSWPTHHYGSWGYSNRWYWIPNHYWGPAWVTWAVSPGYVSWCPTGYNGRPVDAFPGNGGYKYGEPWRSWTTLPANQMTHNVWVTEHTVARNAITPAMRDSFIERPGGPMPAGGAAARRAIAPLHAPTAPSGPTASVGQRSTAVPRGQSQMNDVSPFDAARAPRATAPSRGPVTYTVPSASGSNTDARPRQASAAPSPDRTQAAPSRSISASSPDRTQIISPRDQTQVAPAADRTPGGSAISRERMPAGPAPSVNRAQPQPSRAPRASEPGNAPRATAPQIEVLRGAPDPPTPSRATPREPGPPQAADPSQDRGRSANRAVMPPPSQAAPPSAAYPARRAEPQGPPAAMPPPSYSRGGDRPAPPPSAPPSAQAPPSSGAAPAARPAPPSGRGGGQSQGQSQGQGQAVPRRGGGGGGDR
jgi:hypothetical protein